MADQFQSPSDRGSTSTIRILRLMQRCSHFSPLLIGEVLLRDRRCPEHPQKIYFSPLLIGEVLLPWEAIAIAVGAVVFQSPSDRGSTSTKQRLQDLGDLQEFQSPSDRGSTSTM